MQGWLWWAHTLISATENSVFSNGLGISNREGGGGGSWISNGSIVELDYLQVSSVPEMDPAGTGAVLSLVIGVLGLIERRRVKAA
ncbi:MAG: hypothetical protein DWH79_03705 [Planctomycetota bacterium]|nr:MAG: hypothetical protein DWH79_03705 [Planctomycetota bacterium]